MPGLSRAKELRAERKGLAESMREIIDNPEGEDGTLSAEQEEKFDRLDDRQSELKDRIESIEERENAVAGVESDLADSQGVSPAARMDTAAQDREDPDKPSEKDAQEAYNRAFDAYLRYGMRNLTGEAQDALMRGMAEFEIRKANLPDEVRAQSVAQDTKGGFTVPEGFMNRIEAALKQFGGMRRVRSTVLSTEMGNDLPIPTSDDTSNTGQILSENTQETEQDITFGRTVLNAYVYSSRIVKVPRQLLQDTGVDLVSFIGDRLGERIGRITNTHFTTGDGASKPQGVTVGAATGVTAGATDDFTVDELLDLKHAVDPSYRQSAEWSFNDTVLRELKQKKDGDGRPLWQSGIAIGEPDTIDGDPYVVNQDMPSLATGNDAIAYGDFSKYWIRDVLGFTLLRLDERFADSLQVGFLGFSRHDGALLDAGTNPVQVLTMA